MVFRNFFKAFTFLSNQKDIPTLTNYLAKNETFRKVAINTHKTKQSAFRDLESWLDKELLQPEELKKIEEQRKQQSKNKK